MSYLIHFIILSICIYSLLMWIGYNNNLRHNLKLIAQSGFIVLFMFGFINITLILSELVTGENYDRYHVATLQK